MGMYLCVVVVTCTGIIVSKVSSKPKEESQKEKSKGVTTKATPFLHVLLCAG